MFCEIEVNVEGYTEISNAVGLILMLQSFSIMGEEIDDVFYIIYWLWCDE